MRAVHSRCDRPALIDDPYGDRLLSDAERPFILQRLLLALPEARRAEIAALGDTQHAFDCALRAHPAYAGIIVRARYAEDAQVAAIRRGVTQCVAVAAGMDTFALRHPELAQRLRVFEIDHPATHELKRARFTMAGIETPANVHLIAADLATRSVSDALAASPYDPGKPTLFTVLGLTQYLTRDANLALLRDIAGCSRVGSDVLFDYLDLDAFTASRAAPELRRLAEERAQTDEPWVSGFDPTLLAADLGTVGLRLIEDLDTAALQNRYCHERADRLQVPPHMHVTVARAGRTAEGG